MCLREQAKKHLENMYLSHRAEDIESWNALIDTLFDFVELEVGKHHLQEDSNDIPK